MKKLTLPEWQFSLLGELCLPGTGLQTGPFGSQLHAAEYTETGVPVVMPKDINAGRIVADKVARIPKEKAQELSRHRLKVGDILFARRGDIGRCALVTYQEDGWLCGTGCLRARFRENVYPEFLIQALNHPRVIAWLETNAVGQTMLNLSTGILENLPLFLPPLSEQRAIAAILSTWDEAITLTEHLIAALRQRKQGLMQLLLTGAVRFLEFEDEEWKTFQLQDIASIIMGQSPSSTAYNQEGEGLPLIQGNADIVNRKTAPRIFTREITKYCQVGDIILSVRAPVGETAISLHNACIGRGVCAIRAIASDAHFLYQLLVSIEKQWQQYAQGSTFTAINSTDIRQFELYIPNILAEQKTIAEVLDTCDLEIEIFTQGLDALRVQKKGLMQQLLTGQIRVQVAE